MARVKIREFDAKKLLRENLQQEYKGILIDSSTNIEALPQQHPWLLQEKLVVKPDQLFGKGGKLGLVLINAAFEEVKEYLQNRINKEFTIGKTTDKLTHFLIEPFTPHTKEFYLSIGGFSFKKDSSENHITHIREGNNIFFSYNGGIDTHEKWWMTSCWHRNEPTDDEVKKLLQFHEENTEQNISEEEGKKLIGFIRNVYKLFIELDFTYLEFNPFTFDEKGNIILLDTVAEIDSCASFKHAKDWKNLPFPKPFGRKSFPEEEYISTLDKESGASLKLTILNPQGRIWNILSGGGASIIYLDTIANLGKQEQIANYGEYSGNPTTEETYQYTKTILSLMTKENNPKGKVLIIGGAIANFTDIEKTFIGIIKALQEYKNELREGKISIFVRRGGPNYQRGLKLMEQMGKELEIPITIHGPEIPMTKIVEKAIEALS